MRLLLVLGLAAFAACSDPFGLPRASLTNTVDSLGLFALSGTPVWTPSAYRVEFRQPVRTDQGTVFDFAFDMDSTGEARVYPTGALGLGEASGLQVATEPFDSVLIAPDRGFQLDTAVVVTVGTVVLVHSRTSTCDFGITAFYYAKLQVVAVDTAARRLDFRILVNQNCGYRGLEPGIPSR